MAAFLPKVQRRVRLLAWKLTGSLPHLPWSGLLRQLLPNRWKNPDPLPPSFDVTLIQRSDDTSTVLWDTPLGPFWGKQSDGAILWHLVEEQIVKRVYERPPVTIQQDDIVLDVGSHLGTFSRFALRQGARLVVAFEPDPTNIACFKKTFGKEIEEGRIILVEAAAWDSAGSLYLRPSDDQQSWGPWVHQEPGADPSIKVPTTTIDETVQRLKLPQVNFIKMDIEGAERNAVRGARQTLSRFGPRLVVCLYHRPDDPVAVPQEVLQARPGYNTFFRNLEQAYFH